MDKQEPVTWDINKIMSLVPHRYPMLLIDKVVDITPNESVTAVKNVTINEDFFNGHFPGKPIMPGVLIIESMAQASAVFIASELSEKNLDNKLVYFISIEEARFRKPVVPGDSLHLHVTKLKARSKVWKVKGEARVDNQKVAEATFSAMLVDR